MWVPGGWGSSAQECPRQLSLPPTPSQAIPDCLVSHVTLASTQMQSEINPVTRKWLLIKYCAGRQTLWRTASQNLLDRRACLERRGLGVSAFVGQNLLGGFCFIPAWAPAVFRSHAKVCILRLLNGFSLLVLSLELSS